MRELVDKPVNPTFDETALGCPEYGLYVPVVGFYGRIGILPNMWKVLVACEPHIQLRHPLFFMYTQNASVPNTMVLIF
jgi:hypothetical protein